MSERPLCPLLSLYAALSYVTLLNNQVTNSQYAYASRSLIHFTIPKQYIKHSDYFVVNSIPISHYINPISPLSKPSKIPNPTIPTANPKPLT